MKYRFVLVTLAALSLIVFTAISYAQDVRTIFVGPELVDCVGLGPQKCMVVKEPQDADWTYFYDGIQGFGFKAGYEYELEVMVTEISDPPADASSLAYELIEIVAKNPVAKNVMHIPYKGLCAPGFASSGETCTLDKRCGLGIYPGKICAIDGKIQPYLKPAQQGEAGIIATEVICAEPLQLIFKHDGSPVCVKPESVSKLEKRGWSMSPPIVVCALHYEPVCGVNEQTYGNMCMLNADHVAIKSTGECKKD